MKLTVRTYNSERDYHICVDEAGQVHRVDLLVDGGIKHMRKSLVGKTVECDYLEPFVELAGGVRLCEPDDILDTAHAAKENDDA